MNRVTILTFPKEKHIITENTLAEERELESIERKKNNHEVI